MAKIKGYMMFINGWRETITDVKFKHSARGKGVDHVIKVARLERGQASEVVELVAFDDAKDDWLCEFKDAEGREHHKRLEDEGFKPEDENGVVVAQVTKEDKRLTLHFPVSTEVRVDL